MQGFPRKLSSLWRSRAELSRRRFVLGGGMTAGAALLPFVLGYSRRVHARDYGALVPDPDGIIDLPEGFTYTIVETAGGTMDDGFTTPGLPDGMACFTGKDGNWILMRNHEVPFFDVFHAPYSVGNAPPEAFDDAALGGVSRVVIDPATNARISSNLVLAGTVRNCSGGPSPWGWLSCEEAGDDAGHGYTFLCDPEAATVQPAQQILGYGRYNHEAVAIDPSTATAYLTEDRGNGCVYRFVPDDPCDPFTGTLQALRVVGEDNVLTGSWADGTMAEIAWVDIDEVDPPADTIRVEAQGKGAALFRRGEGVWFHEGQVWFSATDGGPASSGQIFRLTDGADGGMLELVVQSSDANVLDFPDNITIAPWGQLFMCEDGSGGNYIRILTDAGDVVPFAFNSSSGSEFAGVCFSPDGRVLFVNIQFDGLTLAITGPFPEAPAPPPGEEDCVDDTGGDESGGSGDGTAGDAGTADGGSSGADGGASEGVAQTTGDGGSEAGSSDDAGAAEGGDGSGCGCSTERGGTVPALLGVVAAVALARKHVLGDDDQDR